MDLDGDGHRDILSGSYSRMDRDMAGLFQVLYGKADGTFRKAEVLKGTDGEPLIIPADDDKQLTEKICTRPFAVDWDGDGQLDLVVGNFSGTFYWFKGEGKGKFAPKPEPIKAGGKPLKIPGVHSDPFVIDWDGDGDLDLRQRVERRRRLLGGEHGRQGQAAGARAVPGADRARRPSGARVRPEAAPRGATSPARRTRPRVWVDGRQRRRQARPARRRQRHAGRPRRRG